MRHWMNITQDYAPSLNTEFHNIDFEIKMKSSLMVSQTAYGGKSYVI